MGTIRVFIVLIILLAVIYAGCGQKEAQLQPRVDPLESEPILPEWAPENPSEEFLRAAKVLRPIPSEIMSAGAEQKGISARVIARFVSIWLGSYELFGTLSDKQIARFLSVEEIRIPIKSLTESQGNALDRWFERWREAMRGGPSELEDYRIELYKCGANEDLSNVEMGFSVPGGHLVHVKFWIKQPDGSVETRVAEFAQI